ncbi:MAG TPA: TolC family protein [Myxococcota bacterium]|nr:TolC family protein [Myxococcota bacterium]HRY92260.1 TolC family protein [Myxococcota bacterium]HSA22436.1 TolC family protein [Myxococcota bacterium]
MYAKRTRLAAWVGVLLCLPWTLAAGETKRLTLEEAVSLALAQSPRMRSAQAEIDAADAVRKQARAHFGPILQFETRALWFSEPPSLGGGGMTPEQLAALQALAGSDPFDNAMIQFFQDLPSMFESKDYDVTVTARIVQPLSQLYAVYVGYRAGDLGVEVASVARQRRRDELAYQVTEGCLRLLQAQAGVQALEEATRTVEAHVAQARSFVEVGLIGKQDLLQAEVRLAEIRGQLLKVRHGVSLAGAALAMMLGLPAGTAVEVVAPGFGFGPEEKLGVEMAQAMALTRRPELQEIALRLEQAEYGRKLAISGFIPQLSALAMYQYNEGSLMAPPPWTLGLALSWDVWEWGATYYKVEEADAHLAMAQAGREEAERGILLDVERAWMGTREAKELIGVTGSALAHAEEQLRIEQDRYAQHVNTSTDVLDAQTRLTRARVESESARYDYLIAVAALEKAIGSLGTEDSHDHP